VTNPSRIDYEDVKNKRINHRRAPGAGVSVAPSRSETLDLAMSSSTIIVLKALAEHIAARLEERAFCVVFENDLERCWPRKEIARTKREREIQGFAESQGWTAAILEGGFGMRAIFQRLDGSH
jgi:muramoyltetrapeptide carboxypeptidase LdcA involved in peptidoglycan recycling